MADTQEAPQATPDEYAPDGGLVEAQNALLKLMESEEEAPDAEATEPTEEEESQPVEEDEPLEEVAEEESDEDESEDSDNRAVEGEDLYAVTVNGEEQQIHLDELLKGYSRQSDYTKKTQEVSEQRKQMQLLKGQYDREVANIQAERQQYVEFLQQNIQQSNGLSQFDNIDWQTLKEVDPLEYMSKREEYRDAKDKIQDVEQSQSQAIEKYKSDEKKANTEILSREHKLLVEKVPEWGKGGAQKKLASQIRNYAENQGFLKEELDTLADHRSIIVLQKAMMYDQLKKSNPKAKKIKNAPRVIRAGSGVTKDATSKSKRAAKMKRLKQTGHVDDAASAIEDMFNSN